MKLAFFNKSADGFTDIGEVSHQTRMDWPMFQQVHKGRMATDDEIKAAKVRRMDAGFGIWRRDDTGELIAIRNE